MTGQPVQGDEADPVVNGVERFRAAAVEKIFFQRGDLLERFGMVEDAKVVGKFVEGMEIELLEAFLDLLHRGRMQTRAGDDFAERIDVATIRHAPEQGGFDGGSAAANERIVNDVAGAGEALDEKAGELRLETGAIGDFVKAAGGALFGGPEFVDEGQERGNRRFEI